ncbi:sodium:solute symporter [bacterium]|mgnify:FL=1|jgi:Na+/proline symporter|nr:sodium:solute symporter [Flavobacteriaceae bacterium]MDA9073463.1 sodium:solute symporter [bacterium]MDA9253933.1 sodium:solute symporter [Flavobacteriaceae bacterium]MDA9302939.1 sodium:solute symporter [bacterium]MDA9327889.1 sodium:solute symporter [Flavobacteriaceae bacterium]|tara:strand:+ start:17 stop:1894 length:1878 start_codon:yes stop_codon:yes gene_type:complete
MGTPDLHPLDWFVLGTTLLFIVLYGVYKTRKIDNGVEDYIKGGNDTKWWTIGLSVMATQASAITFLSTPGQAFHDGMGFVQFYFGLPIAMIIICLVFIPIYYKLNVYTAYEYLETRFDLKTRSLTAFLFLIQRGLAAGITIYAPAIILSYVLGWDLIVLNIVIGLLVIFYTVSGGTKAVNVTQKQQMIIIFLGMVTAFTLIMYYMPDGITFSKALDIAGASDKMKVLDFSFDLNNRYTVWTGFLGGTFLMLSYFGTDQSQVQRYLSGKSLRESQLGLLFNGLLKVPMQFFILLTGVMVFVFYQFNASPLNFNPKANEAVISSVYYDEYKELEKQHIEIENQKKILLLDGVQENEKDLIIAFNKKDRALKVKAKEIIEKVATTSGDKIQANDKDYVFIHFIVNNLPKGIIGLLLAVILAAAMSSTASELNALASTTTIDVYKRNIVRGRDETHYVKASKWLTLGWGILAILIACVANLFDNLIQLVNIIGSVFYGNVLGIFLLAFFFKKVQGNAVFVAAIITQTLILLIYYFGIYELENLGLEPVISYLWLNFVGCILVIFTALMFSFKSNRLYVRAVLVLISIALIKVVYDVVYLKLTLYHVLVLMLLFILIGVLSIEKKSSINS